MHLPVEDEFFDNKNFLLKYVHLVEMIENLKRFINIIKKLILKSNAYN